MSKARVLVADDEENLRHVLGLHLQRGGFEVTAVADGEAAVRRACEEDFDLILCDLVMPRLNGVQVIEGLRAAGQHTPVVLMSAHADRTAIESVQSGADDFLRKPFDSFESVIFRLKKVLEMSALRRENEALKRAGEIPDFENIVGDSAEMRALFRSIHKVANFKTTVLITGESGTGKELVAQALHRSGGRADRAFVAVNCGAIPEALLESELFGHARGAFTGASRSRRGLFEEADGGTLLLDEIGELPLSLQVKLLRVLQEGEVRRVGESRPVPVDVRVVAATVRDLASEVSAGRFREDLYYRLNVLTLTVPPLRDRRADIPLLVGYFIRTLNARLGTAIEGLTAEARRMLLSYSWPGNVRELQNAIERSLVLADEALISPEDLPPRIQEANDPIRLKLAAGEMSIKKMSRIIEEELIRRALTKTGGNRTRTAELLEISHRALLYKIKDYRVEL